MPISMENCNDEPAESTTFLLRDVRISSKANGIGKYVKTGGFSITKSKPVEKAIK